MGKPVKEQILMDGMDEPEVKADQVAEPVIRSVPVIPHETPVSVLPTLDSFLLDWASIELRMAREVWDDIIRRLENYKDLLSSIGDPAHENSLVLWNRYARLFCYVAWACPEYADWYLDGIRLRQKETWSSDERFRFLGYHCLACEFAIWMVRESGLPWMVAQKRIVLFP